MIAPALAYAEAAPPAALAPWVACAWELRGGRPAGDPVPHRILPDGCTDVVVDLRPSGEPRQVVGPMSRAACLEIAGPVDVLGVRPGGLRLLSSLPADALRDAACEPGQLPGLAHGRLAADALRRALDPEPLVAAATLARRADRLWRALALAARHAQPRDPLLAHAIARWMAPGAGNRGVAALARESGVAERTLERRLLCASGLRAVELRRLVRFRRVLRLHAAGLRSWSALATEAGYSDQPHLVREFRAFAGVTPSAWAAEQAGVGFLQDGTLRVA